MQNLRGVIKFFTWLLVVVCFVQLSWTFMARSVESKADGYAASSVKVAEPQNLSAAEKIAFRDSVEQVTKMYRRNYLDSVSGIPVVDVWGIRDFTTYKFCREHALSLGLDLKGGMSLILEIAEDDVLRSLAYNSKDAQFNQAIINTKQKQKTAPGDFLTLFLKEYEALNPNGKLAGIFSPIEAYKGKIIPTSSNSEVINILRGDFDKAVKTTFQVLKTRIDQFGVASPNISLQENTGRIILELPGVDDPTRVRKLLQATAQLEFWDTYEVQEVFNYLDAANTTLRTSLNKKAEVAVDTTTTAAATTEPATDSTTTAGEALFTNTDTTNNNTKDTTAKAADKANENSNPLFEVLYPNIVSDGQSQRIGEGPMVGQALGKDTARVNRLLARPEVRSTLPRDLVLLWGAHPAGKNSNVYQLFAIKKNPSSTEAPLTGSAITNATQSFDQNGIPEVDIAMNALGAAKWERMTEAAVNSQVNGRPTKRCIAIVLDNRVFSAPRVQQKIAGGKSQITGIDQLEEAIDLANILKSGKLEAKTRIIQEQVIGPSLGKESIKAGLMSLALGFTMVFLFMVLYYNRSGVIANIAMLLNLFILVCVLIGMGTSFTLPAMAGLLLTLAMAVDANVIINERVREEVKRGKGLRLAVDEGYGHSYNAIIDGNLTTMLVGIALMVFGLGPIQGFGVVLVAGLFTSMFTAVLVSRVLFDSAFNRNIAINFGNNITNNLFKNINFDFIGKKKISYTISTIIFVVSIASMLTLGFDLGVDFKGGRSYVIQFDKDINTQELSSGLEKSLGSTPQIKTYGSNNQLSVTTAYLVEEEGNAADSTVEAKVYEGVKPFFEKAPSLEEFRSKNVKSSIKIGAAVADDIRGSAFWAILFSLSGVFLYIFLRFKRWEYAAGAIVALIHDPVLVLGAFSLLRFVLPFSLEIDQNIVAAILTLIGYSVNDTVVVFDRIRETVGLHPTRSIEQNVNESINQTLSRTIMTVMTVLLVALILFVFGGAPIRGFSFALIIGLLIGTYSSIFVASPIMVDLINRKKK